MKTIEIREIKLGKLKGGPTQFLILKNHRKVGVFLQNVLYFSCLLP